MFRFSARLSLLAAIVTIFSFLYILVLPLVRREQPDVSNVVFFFAYPAKVA